MQSRVCKHRVCAERSIAEHTIIWFKSLKVSLGELSVQRGWGSAESCRTDGQMWTDRPTDPWLIVHLSASPAESMGRSTALCRAPPLSNSLLFYHTLLLCQPPSFSFSLSLFIHRKKSISAYLCMLIIYLDCSCKCCKYYFSVLFYAMKYTPLVFIIYLCISPNQIRIPLLPSFPLPLCLSISISFSLSLFLILSASLYHFLFALFLLSPNLYFSFLSPTPPTPFPPLLSSPLLSFLPLSPSLPRFGHNAAFCGIFYYAVALPRWIQSNWGG